MRLRDYTPRGYNARHILILIVPMIIFVVSMSLYFFYAHVQQVNSRLSRAVADELAYVISERKTNPQEWSKVVEGFRRAGLMEISFTPGVTPVSCARAARPCCSRPVRGTCTGRRTRASTRSRKPRR